MFAVADRRRPRRRRAARDCSSAPASPPDAVEDVILGHCYPNSEAPAIGRVVALDAGLPVTVPGMQVDRRCGSGLQAVIQACLQVATGDNDLVVAGGAESDEQRRLLLHRHALGRSPRRGHRCTTGWPAAAPPPAASTTRCPAACSRPPRTCAASTASPRQEQDELAVALAPAGGRRAAERHPRRGDHPGHGVHPPRRAGDRHRRTSPRRHLGRVAGQAQTGSGQAGSGRHRDRRQLQRPERRRLHVHRHHRRRRPPNSA